MDCRAPQHAELRRAKQQRAAAGVGERGHTEPGTAAKGRHRAPDDRHRPTADTAGEGKLVV